MLLACFLHTLIFTKLQMYSGIILKSMNSLYNIRLAQQQQKPPKQITSLVPQVIPQHTLSIWEETQVRTSWQNGMEFLFETNKAVLLPMDSA